MPHQRFTCCCVWMLFLAVVPFIGHLICIVYEFVIKCAHIIHTVEYRYREKKQPTRTQRERTKKKNTAPNKCDVQKLAYNLQINYNSIIYIRDSWNVDKKSTLTKHVCWNARCCLFSSAFFSCASSSSRRHFFRHLIKPFFNYGLLFCD